MKGGGQDSAERAGSEGMKGGGGRIVLRGRGVRV